MNSKHIILVAGETSGDMHAAHLVAALKKLDPSLTFSGLGGPQMLFEGVKIYFDLTKVAVVGFWEVLKHFGVFKKNFHLIIEKIKETKPAAIILIDYPGFNLRLAKGVKEQNPAIKVIYYISPQVWAWKESRVKLIKKYIDRMLVIFPFEKEFYARHGIDVDFVGHPLIETIKIHTPKEKLLTEVGLSLDKLTVGLLPGSRPKEVDRHLPIMLQSAQLLLREFKNIQFLLIKAPSISEEQIKWHLESVRLPLRIIENQTYEGINAADVCIVCSGTATLETGLLKKPMVVIYKISPLTYTLAKRLVKVSYIAMVNVIANKKIVPECIQREATPRKIAEELKAIMTNEPRIAEIKSELEKIRHSLGEAGASQRAAFAVLKTLGN